jgi:DNA-binding XRE family transcriptional regulator
MLTQIAVAKRARSEQELVPWPRSPRPKRGPDVRISQNHQLALGRAVRLRREEIKLTQEALADAADLDLTSIRGLERGVGNPTWDVADRVARALGLVLHELARKADELESADRRPTDRSLRAK